MDASEFKNTAHRFAQVCTRIHGAVTTSLAEKVCEVMKQRLQLKASQLIQSAATRPILFHYQADGTPMKIKKNVVSPAVAQPGVQGVFGKFKRFGYVPSEYLSQRAYLKTWGDDGSGRVCALIPDPRPMDKGKSQWYLYKCSEGVCTIAPEDSPCRSLPQCLLF